MQQQQGGGQQQQGQPGGGQQQPKAKKEPAPPKVRPQNYFPSMQEHGGGSWKWYGPSSPAVRERVMGHHPFPSNRGQMSRRMLARKIASGVLKATREDLTHLMAATIKSVSMYMAYHHYVVGHISNTIPSTLAGWYSAVQECRKVQGMMMKHIDGQLQTGKQCFYMRGEFRFVRLAEIMEEDPPNDGMSRAEAARQFMQDMVAILYYHQFELWHVGIQAMPEISQQALLFTSSMELAAIEGILRAAERTLHLTTNQPLRHLNLNILLKLHRHLSVARASLFACTTTEMAILDAIGCLADLAGGRRPLASARGHKQVMEAQVRILEGFDVTPPPPQGPAKTLSELWQLVAQTFTRKPEIVALLGILNVSYYMPGPKRQSMGRAQLMTTFAQAMSTRRDATAIALARQIYPKLPAKLAEELVEAGGPKPGPPPATGA